MERIAAGLARIASSVFQITWPEAPDGGDAADYLAWGRTSADVRVLIDEAVDLRTRLPAAVPSPSGDIDEQEPESRKSQASVLIDLASSAELFHTPDTTVYARVPVGGHRETWALGSDAFSMWLQRAYWQKTRRAASAQAIQDALGVLAAQGQFDGPEQAVDVRLARRADTIYLDLGDPEWRAVEVTSAGWSIVTDPPVRFRRPSGLLRLPEPAHGGSLHVLRDLLNLSDENQWRLVVAWLVASLRPEGPYPVLVLGGEQGSAKSTTARFLRAIIDPNVSPDRAAPRGVHDLAIAANNGWIVSFDNLSGLSDWLSDALARLATGAGFATRTLYENDAETLFYASRPILLNGIGELAVRSDLLDRALLVDLPRLPDERRRTEMEVRTTFEAARPSVLGALLDAVSVAIGRVATVKLASLPRMADFATWSVAAESGLDWPSGSFMAAYVGNRRAAATVALDASVIVPAIRALVRRGAWQGTASELLAALRSEAGEDGAEHQGWPPSPRALTAELTRLAPGLRADGISWERPHRTHGGARVHALRAVPDETGSTVTTVTADLQVGADEHETSLVEGDCPGEQHGGRVTVSAGRVTVSESGDGWDGLVASLPIVEPASAGRPQIDQYAPASIWDSELHGDVPPEGTPVPVAGACV